MALFFSNWPPIMNFPLDEGPVSQTCEFKQSLFFLASTAASTDLVQHIVPPHLRDIPVPYRDEAETLWSEGHDHPPPVGTAQRH